MNVTEPLASNSPLGVFNPIKMAEEAIGNVKKAVTGSIVDNVVESFIKTKLQIGLKVAGDFIENHPRIVLLLILIMLIISPIIIFACFAIVSIILSITGFCFIEGAFIISGLAVLLGTISIIFGIFLIVVIIISFILYGMDKLYIP